MSLTSPVTPSNSAVPDDCLDVGRVVKAYRDMGIDVTIYFAGMDELMVYRCLETGYRFFHPPELAGKEDLYRSLQQVESYYRRWKWENDEAMRFLIPGMRVLDIGCGEGLFISRLLERGLRAEGLELNRAAADAGRDRGFVVHSASLAEFAAENEASFDAVCAFQVLEHVYDVHGFMDAVLRAIRPGGLVVFAVPNNNPYLYRFDRYHALNLPPHHMGLWNEASLRKTAELFGLAVESIAVEPLHPDERRSYFQLCVDHRCGGWIPVARVRTIMAGALWRLNRRPIKGRNIVAVWRKIDSSASPI